MDLSGQWEAQIADDVLRRVWMDENDTTTGWHDITVPSHWRSTPAFKDTHGPLLYRKSFEHNPPTEGERLWLMVDGAFYQSDIWIDGAYIGDTEGYFFPHSYEITDLLAGRTEHRLGIELACPRVSDSSNKRILTGAYQAGDSASPDQNPGGIWAPVRIERSGPIRIRHLRIICSEATTERATLAIRTVLDSSSAQEVTVTTSVCGLEHIEQFTVAAGENQFNWVVPIAGPQLWWPRSLGEQPLHDVTVSVRSNIAKSALDSPPSDTRTRRVGLRTIKFHNWVISVNSERLHLKGATHMPTRALIAEASSAEVRLDVLRAIEAGFNFLRVHSHVARPELYEAADEVGLLLWQDLPLHGDYARTMRKQVVRQAREAVDLLGHHPAVAIWCAHDAPALAGVEEDERLGLWRRTLRQQIPSWNMSVLDRFAKRTLQREDGSRPVIPHSGIAPHIPALDGTDAHLSFGWIDGDERQLAGISRLAPRMVRFVSQLSVQAVPPSAEFMKPELWPNLNWQHLAYARGMQEDGFELWAKPASFDSFESWSEASQAHQASSLKRQIELLRRIKYTPNGGFAVHWLADPSPLVSSALLDHQRRPKAAWQAVIEACAPVIVVSDPLEPSVSARAALALDVHVVSDLRVPLEKLLATVEVTWPNGSHTWRFEGDVAADSVARVGTIQMLVPEELGELVLSITLTDREDRVVCRNSATTEIVA